MISEPIDLYQSNRTASRFRRMPIDLTLVSGLLLFSAMGLSVLYSAGGQNLELLGRQATRLAIAFVIMLLIAHIKPEQLQRYSPILYLFGTALLIAVLYAGEIGKGAQRWLNVGGFRFQPAEMIKLTTPMMIAWYLAEYPIPPSLRNLAVSTVLIAVPTVLIAKQPDLGTALLVASSGIAVIFFAGVSWRLIAAVSAAAVALLPLLWYTMRDYQRDRVLTFLNPESDPLGKGYHIIQSKIAIGSGGIYGKGWLNGTQSHLEFLPERSTDFIFAVFAEEFGLLGCLALVASYLLIIARCLYIAVQAQTTYSRLLASSLTVTFFVYVFVNIGMVIGILPVVGIPLPLISYGGTSMVTLVAGFGILMSIQNHRKLLTP